MMRLRKRLRPPDLRALAAACLFVAALSVTDAGAAQLSGGGAPPPTVYAAVDEAPLTSRVKASLGARMAAAALARTRAEVTYDPAYRRLAYPNGDVAADRGVCSDVVIRVLRAVGLDLQRLVHEDMRAAFSAYPKLWGARGPDRNIDHRRVPNLETFLTRAGARLPQSNDPNAFLPGDIVAWNLRGEAGVLPHIGVVTHERGASGWPKIVHNIGRGPEHEDVLLLWPITGHYRIAGTDLSAGL